MKVVDMQSNVPVVRSAVMESIVRVAGEHGAALPALTDELHLLDSGLDSLCLAVIVARLEDQLGVDPFSTSDDMVLPVTVGDFVALYEQAVRAKHG
jgi:acyl carrier protein